MVSALDYQVGYRGLESCSSRDNFSTISMLSSYSTCPGFSKKDRAMLGDRQLHQVCTSDP